MSSPIPQSSQNIEVTDNDTPGTTPPAPVSRTATPVADIEMADANEDHNETLDNNYDVDVEIQGVEDTKAPPAEIEEEEDASLTLPVSKIKKIFKMDPDYLAASQSAVYATGVATELFIQYLVEQASLSAKVDRRKKIVYKDFSNAVSNQEALHFLSDTVPKTQPIGALIENKKVNLSQEDQENFDQQVNINTVDDAEDIEIDDVHAQPKKPSTKVAPVLPKGQQTLNFGIQKKEAKPIKKAVIDDLVTADDNMETTPEGEN